MVAASNPVLRLRRLIRERRRGIIAAAVAATVATALAAPVAAGAGVFGMEADRADASAGAAAAGAGASASTTEETTETGFVSIDLAPTVGTTLDPAAVVAVDVEITNGTGEPVPAGIVRLTRSEAAIDDRAELAAWLDDGTEHPAEILAETASPALAAGSTVRVAITAPAGSLDPVIGPVFGVGAEIVVEGGAVAAETAVFASSALTPTAATPRLALAYAITVPAETDGLIAPDLLELWTGPVGLLSRELDAVADQSVAVAVDPRIIASIRVLGSSAPASSLLWLDRLAGISNEVFPLAYADADLTGQTQSGVGVLPAPSFADVLDPDDFGTGAGGEGDEGATAQDAAASASPSPSVEPTTEPEAPDTLPTTDELLSWPYTRTDLAWPAAATVASGDLAAFRTAGLTTTILEAANVTGTAPDSSATVEGESVVVADAGISDALRAAASASGEITWAEATGRIGAELAMRASVGDGGIVLATFPRGATTQSARVGSLVGELGTWGWAGSASLSEAIGAPPVDLPLVSTSEDATRLDYLARLFDSDARMGQFATVLADPTLLTAPTRRALFALLDESWRTDFDAWADAVGERLVDQTATMNAISVAPSSTVNVLSSQTGVPTTVENLLPYPVTVFVDAQPSNGRLLVEERVETTVAPESRSNVIVPVAAGVGRGEVTLTVSLFSAAGVQVGRPIEITANVQADWEGIGAAILAALVVAFFGFGIWRSVRRRRRTKAEASASATTDDADATDDAGPADPAAPADAPGATELPRAQQPTTEDRTDG
ncbi:DUF6049 family protein [Agromyces sp. LHK192]|uniref:DUF6049 family protein n=1 Tax=Agromyces sp. LHK192 TaxID=2498704 RepID=UPI000FD6CA15|nr:DUF6049 family protein [Agromyces sp. LHK192]